MPTNINLVWIGNYIILSAEIPSILQLDKGDLLNTLALFQYTSTRGELWLWTVVCLMIWGDIAPLNSSTGPIF